MTSKRSDTSRRRSWTKAEIRAARHIPLKPVLEALGYPLHHLKGDNYQLSRPGADIVVKEHYWRDRQDGSAGNTIDFLVQVKGMSFNDAMKLLHASSRAGTS